MNQNEIKAHLKRCKENALSVPNKLEGKILPPEKQKEFEFRCKHGFSLKELVNRIILIAEHGI